MVNGLASGFRSSAGPAFLECRGSGPWFAGEAVADAANGFDHPGIVAELGTQRADVDVDGAVEDDGLGANRGFEEIAARERLAGVSHEGVKESELGRRHGQQLAAG